MTRQRVAYRTGDHHQTNFCMDGRIGYRTGLETLFRTHDRVPHVAAPVENALSTAMLEALEKETAR